MDVIVVIVLGVVAAIAAEELLGWADHLARIIVRRAARHLPADRWERYEKEWLGELSVVPGRGFSRLIWSIAQPWLGARPLRRELTGAASASARPARVRVYATSTFELRTGQPVTRVIERNIDEVLEIVEACTEIGSARWRDCGRMRLPRRSGRPAAELTVSDVPGVMTGQLILKDVTASEVLEIVTAVERTLHVYGPWKTRKLSAEGRIIVEQEHARWARERTGEANAGDAPAP